MMTKKEVRKKLAIKTIYRPFYGYTTKYGKCWNSTIENWLESSLFDKYKGKVNLILTSPPFPLNRKKSYGNLAGEKYLNWLAELAPRFSKLLTKNGSLVIEIGNAWNPGEPTLSTLPIESLLAVKNSADFYLCQEFICHNPARLPSPVQYVNIDRSRVKDSWTRVWWLSKSKTPYANNKNILIPYSKSMQNLLKSKKYNSGERPSEHRIGTTSFLKNNGGAIPASCLTQEVLDYYGSLIISGNTKSNGDKYLDECKRLNKSIHPARMQSGLAKYFINFLTKSNEFVFDPFSGSNTTGYTAELLKRKWGTVEASMDFCKTSKFRFL